MEIMGIRPDTVVKDNVARRCEGCLEVIEGTPWRMNILDIVSTEVAAPGTSRRRSTRARSSSTPTRPTSGAGWQIAATSSAAKDGSARSCARSPSRAPMAPPVRWGLCDGIHRDDHELIPA